MISVALISGLIVIAASAKASIDAEHRRRHRHVATSSSAPTTRTRFSPEVADRIAKVSGVEAVHRVRQQQAKVGDTRVQVSGVSDGTLDGPITTKLDSGSFDGLGEGQALLPRTWRRRSASPPARRST